MLRLEGKLPLSSYYELYDLLVPQDDKYRRLDELIDFDFIRRELFRNYSFGAGRGALDPVLLFKYLVAKEYEGVPDSTIIERSRYDLSIKRFLGYMPEDEVISPAVLTLFRRRNLKDDRVLDILFSHLSCVALENGISVEELSQFSMRPAFKDGPVSALSERLKALLTRVYVIRPEMHKKIGDSSLPDDEAQAVAKCESILRIVKEEFAVVEEMLPGILERETLYLREAMDDACRELAAKSCDELNIPLRRKLTLQDAVSNFVCNVKKLLHLLNRRSNGPAGK